RVAGRRPDVLAVAGRQYVAEARLGRPAVRPDVRPAWLGHEPPPTSALLSYGADRGRRRRADGCWTTWARGRRLDDASGVQRVDVRSGPASGRNACGQDASAASGH